MIKKSKVTAKMEDTIHRYLPDDIVFGILSKMPVKSVIRFMCVCNSWNSLIRSSAFVTAHDQINRSESLKNSHLVHIPDDNRKAWQVCTLLREIPAPPSYVKQSNLLLPFSRYDNVIICDGLICLIKKFYNISHDIYIWNPCIGSLKIIPPSKRVVEGDEVAFGFGFAQQTNDYRVVKLRLCDWRLCEVEIYSLGLDSWRRIQCKQANQWVLPHLAVYLKGSIYWLAKSSDSLRARRLILRFDVDEETFEEMEAPPFHCFHPELVVANGFLVLLDFYERSDHVFVVVWVKNQSWMEERHSVLKGRNLPKTRMIRGGHIVLERWDEKRILLFDYDSAYTVSLSLMDMEVFSTISERFHLIRVRETLVLLDEQHKCGHGFGTPYHGLGKNGV